MIVRVQIYDERTGEEREMGEPNDLILHRAINLLIEEHNALVEAVALYMDRPLARQILRIDSGPEAISRSRDALLDLLSQHRDPNPEMSSSAWMGDVSGSGIDLRADAAREEDANA